MKKKIVPHTAKVLVLLILVAGCGDSNPAGSFEPRITNETDSFSFWANNVYLVTERLNYSWANTGTSASVYHASARSNGTGTLILLDAEGRQVYQSDLKSNATEVAEAGVPGTWTVVLDLRQFSGTINFRVTKL